MASTGPELSRGGTSGSVCPVPRPADAMPATPEGSTDGPGSLTRRLGLRDAVVLGLGSMIGAGVFSAFAPAARAAGSWLLLGLALAAAVAWANATSTAQLAAQYPRSGGAYLFGRERLGPWWGFTAGWGFVVGKTASSAAMAMTFAAYLVPPAWQRATAVTAVLALAAVNYRGITRTARAARVLVAVVLGSLAVVVVAGLVAGEPSLDRLAQTSPSSVHGVLQSAGLLFFAFAGYARVATLGEEVRDPGRTIPRAVGIALGLTVIVYAVVAMALLTLLGPTATAGSPAPVVALVADLPWAAPIARVGAAAASLGALLALLAGLGRTSLAMAREGDLPRALAAVHPAFHVPHRAELVQAAAIVVLVLTVDLRGAIGFSSFGVLVYYLVAHLAARTQTGSSRRSPRAVQTAGAVACLVLVASLPIGSVLSGLLVLGAGLGGRWLHRRRSAPRMGGTPTP